MSRGIRQLLDIVHEVQALGEIHDAIRSFAERVGTGCRGPVQFVGFRAPGEKTDQRWCWLSQVAP